MRFSIHNSRVNKLLAQRNGYLVLSAGLLLVCLLLSTMVLRLIGRERTIIVPPVVHSSFWVDHQEVSPEYLAEMTNFFAQLRLTVNPSNAAYQREALLRYTDPSYYGALKNELVAEADHLEASHISLAFYPVNLQVDAKHLVARITGDLQANVGDDPLPAERVSYHIVYRYDQGRLLLKSFSEEAVESKPREQLHLTAHSAKVATQGKSPPLVQGPRAAAIDKTHGTPASETSNDANVATGAAIREAERQVVVGIPKKINDSQSPTAVTAQPPSQPTPSPAQENSHG